MTNFWKRVESFFRSLSPAHQDLYDAKLALDKLMAKPWDTYDPDLFLKSRDSVMFTSIFLKKSAHRKSPRSTEVAIRITQYLTAINTRIDTTDKHSTNTLNIVTSTGSTNSNSIAPSNNPTNDHLSILNLGCVNTSIPQPKLRWLRFSLWILKLL